MSASVWRTRSGERGSSTQRARRSAVPNRRSSSASTGTPASEVSRPPSKVIRADLPSIGDRRWRLGHSPPCQARALSGPDTRANREKVGTPMPIWRDGGVDGWIVFGGPARAGPGGGGGGRHARGGGAAGRGRALHRPPAGAGGPRRGAACRRAREARAGGGRAAERPGGGPKPRIGGEVEAALPGLLKEANRPTLAECR